MKKMILASAFLLSSAAFAQVSPNQVCQKIATYNSSKAAQCAQVISRGTFDAGSIRVAQLLANAYSSTEAVNVLTATTNAFIDVEAVKVCEKIATYNAAATVTCMTNIANKTYSPNAVKVIRVLANAYSSSEANTALMKTANAYINPSAVLTCEKIATYNSSASVRCLEVIANKEFMNQSESTCYTLANSYASSDAIQCLVNVAIDYVPAPVPREIIISDLELRDLKRDLRKAQNMLERGMVDRAQMSLGEALRLIETIEANNSPRR